MSNEEEQCFFDSMKSSWIISYLVALIDTAVKSIDQRVNTKDHLDVDGDGDDNLHIDQGYISISDLLSFSSICLALMVRVMMMIEPILLMLKHGVSFNEVRSMIRVFI